MQSTLNLGAHPALEQSVAAGKAARQPAPLESHQDFSAAALRDPTGLFLRRDESPRTGAGSGPLRMDAAVGVRVLPGCHASLDGDAVYTFLRTLFTGYALTLPAHQRRLAERFTVTRVARNVVGVGSVGTETWILLMEPDDGFEPQC